MGCIIKMQDVYCVDKTITSACYPQFASKTEQSFLICTEMVTVSNSPDLVVGKKRADVGSRRVTMLADKPKGRHMCSVTLFCYSLYLILRLMVSIALNTLQSYLCQRAQTGHHLHIG
jgi:hypothetical protein